MTLQEAKKKMTVRRLIARRICWIKGEFAAWAKEDPVTHKKLKAKSRCWCLIGAVKAVFKKKKDRARASVLLAQAILELYGRRKWVQSLVHHQVVQELKELDPNNLERNEYAEFGYSIANADDFVIEFNDHENTTHEMVCAVAKKAKV